MIYVLEIPEAGPPRAWFAFDDMDLLRKAAPLSAEGDTRYVYWDEAEAVGAFEGGDARIAGPDHWRARRALYGQLVALDVLADDN